MKQQILARIPTYTTYILLVFIGLFIFSGCSSEFITKNPTNRVMNKFDGYNWSWRCGSQEFNFTLWKDNMDLVKPSAGFWLIQGDSSDRGDISKSKSRDESARILIVYNLENDSVVNWVHGKQVPTLPDMSQTGEILNKIGVEYCSKD